MDYNLLEEYGVIGNLQTVALVSCDGAIDWCCLPHVDSPSLFARLLDHNRGGHFTIQPARSFESVQQYVDGTNVLQTEFQTASGELTVTDFMPVPQLDGVALSTIYRRITCESGQVTIDIDYPPRFEYAQIVPTVKATQHGIVATGDNERAVLTSSTPLSASSASATATTTLEAGETRWMVLGYKTEPELEPTVHQQTLDEVVMYWLEWVHQCPDQEECAIGGPWHTCAIRSALALKLLTHWHTGAICAAPTTSLPEDVGGGRNWDYRFNWIRDAAFTVSALAELGHLEEAEAYFDLCLDHCRNHAPENIQPVYGLRGGKVMAEETLDHLSGYRHSAPVRIGNEAQHQQQLDVYGELALAFYEAARYGTGVSEDDWEVVRDLISYVCDAWDEPDYGIWEVRSDPRNFVYSKVMCWTALDRGIKYQTRERTLQQPPSRSHRKSSSGATLWVWFVVLVRGVFILFAVLVEQAEIDGMEVLCR